jgi:hypothetical protein
VSRQRKRGQKALVYQTGEVTDRRGNTKSMVDLSKPLEVRAAFIPQRSARAEVPGQQHINVTRMICDPDLPDVDLWSRVEWAGKSWDIVTPPSLHIGTRHTRHWSLDLRERP